MKKISVIIPCYNSVKWLPKCFMSLVEQSIGIDNLELIFVNDASTDDGQTWDMLKEMEKAYPESIIIIEDRVGQGMKDLSMLRVSILHLWILMTGLKKAYTKKHI